MNDTTDTEATERRPGIPEWVDLDKLPYGDEERIAARTLLGGQGFELAALLAEWVVTCRPYRENVYLGMDDGELRDAIEAHLGFELIHKTEILVSEINYMLERDTGPQNDQEYAEWIARHPDVFGEHPSSAT